VSTAEGPSEDGRKVTYVADDEDADLLPYAVRSRHSVAIKKTFPSAEAVLRAVLAGECTLRRAEGVRVAYIGETIFINGEVMSTSQYSQGATFAISFALTVRILYVLHVGVRAPQHSGLQRCAAGSRTV
jgi:hypothetical protein